MSELPAGRTIFIGEKQFEVSVAETALSLMSGLKGVTSLEPYDGMLFDFGVSYDVIMTPKGLLFPVEVAFILDSGKILEIKLLDPEVGFTHGSSVPVRFALEVPVGFFGRHDIKVGDFVSNLS